MNIFIDESGSFISAPSQGSLCVVAAVTVPESARKYLESAASSLKKRLGRTKISEIKLKDNIEVAKHLSRLTIWGRVGDQSIKLVTFEEEARVSGNTAKVIRTLSKYPRPTILRD